MTNYPHAPIPVATVNLPEEISPELARFFGFSDEIKALKLKLTVALTKNVKLKKENGKLKKRIKSFDNTI